jgi:hypothetical protein
LEKKLETLDGTPSVVKPRSKMTTASNGVDIQENKEWTAETEVGRKANSKRRRKDMESSVGHANDNTTQHKPTANGNVKLVAKSNGAKSLDSKVIIVHEATYKSANCLRPL